MAYNAVSGALSTSNNATSSSSTVPLAVRRRYDLSDKVIFKEYGGAPFLAMLSKRMQKKAVTDPEFKTLEDSYPRLSHTLTGNTAAGAAAALAVTTDYVGIPEADEFIQPGDVLHVNADATNQTNASALKYGENMVVVRVNETGDDAYCQVIRANGSGGSNATGVSAASGETLDFTIIGNVNREGSNSREALTHGMSEELNYIQEMRYAWEITKTMQNTKMWGGDDLVRMRRLGRKVFLRLVERNFISGQRNKVREAGKDKRFTGGLTWFLGNGNSAYTSWSAANDLVKGNGTSRIWDVGSVSDPDNWSTRRILEFCKEAFKYGGSTKYVFAGSGFIFYFQLLFEKYLRWTPDKDTFGLHVVNFNSPWGTLKILRHEEMTLGGYTNDAFVVDLDYVGYRYLKNCDVQVERNIQAPGVHTTKEGLFAYIGLALNFWEAHSWITGITA